MHYFVFLNFEVLSSSNYDKDFIYNEMEELGLYSKLKLGNSLQPLPEGTFIGEYKFEDKEELKNTIYTEVSELFNKNGINASAVYNRAAGYDRHLGLPRK